MTAGSVSCYLVDGLPLDDVKVDAVDVEAIEIDPDEPLIEQDPTVKDDVSLAQNKDTN